MGGQRGLTLVELVVAMVITSIIVAAAVYLVFPVRQAVDLSVRAELTDAADGALQRMARDIRLALPNSIRLTCGAQCVEFVPVRTAGRYRTEPSGAGCDQAGDTAGSDELAFDVADTCFKSIGTLPDRASIVADPLNLPTNDFLVLNNHGTDFAGQNAYDEPSANRVRLVQADQQAGVRERINFVAPVVLASTFVRSLHDSPGRRFFIVSTPVAYECAGGSLRRFSGYAFGAAHATGTAALVANNVSSCAFDYSQNVTSNLGLLTLRLTLSKNVSSGEPETVTLYHSIHVSNVP
jgi:MSHA biogenesis protein MshO